MKPANSNAIVPSSPEVRVTSQGCRLLRLLLCFFGVTAALLAQTAPPVPAAATLAPGRDEAAVVLSPFEVTASSDMGYEATETLAGSRLNTQLRDVATQINVMTREFMEDLGITNLDDAMTYSLNTENRFESIDVDTTDFGSADSVAVVGGGQGGRTRGLGSPNNSHDFFDTFIRTDSYNTERFTFASGPNSILFGNSSPAGTIDTTFKRAHLNKQSLQLSTRITSTLSRRAAIDLNQPLFRRTLALRVAALADRDLSWRQPAFQNQDRLYATLTYSPLKQVTIRAYHENGRFNQQVAKNTLVQDHVTPWIEAGKPLYNNRLGQTLLSPTTNPPIHPALRRPNAAVRPIASYDSSGYLGFPITSQQNMALTTGYVDFVPAPDNFERSITDQRVYPYDRSFNGNASQARFYSWVRGAVVEANPFKNFFIEVAFNEEQIRNRGVEFMDARVHELNADPNMFLDDRITPNPKVGQFYVENAIAGVNNRAAKNFGAKQQMRASFSYELNFAERPGWIRWLGAHRFAFLADQLESTNVSEVSLLRVSPSANTPVPGSYSFVTTNANSQQIGFRYYIDPAQGDWTIKLPFDVNRDGAFTQPGWRDVNGKQVYVASFDPSVPTNTPSVAHTEVESTSFVVQSSFLQRRLALSYGRRRDDVDIQSELNKAGDWNFDQLLRGIRWETIRSDVPVNTVKSAVAHPFHWLSLAYAETTSQQVRTEVVRNLDGAIAPLGSGIGKDYGVTLRWKNWFSIRLNKYENAGIGNRSALANATPTPAEGNLGPQLKQTIGALERGIQVLAPDYNPARPEVVPASVRSPRFGYYQDDLAFNTQPDDVIGNAIGNRYEVVSDSVAKGYELTLTGNPTPNWRIAITGAKNTASESNIGGQYWDFIAERMPLWSAPANLDKILPATTRSGLSTNYRTYRQVLAVAALNWNYIHLSEGRLNNNIRKYRFNSTTRYAFSRGALKGTFVGANYAWRSAAAVGYPMIVVSDNPFLVPGVAGRTLSVTDINRPYRGGAFTSLDAFIGYSRRLAEGKVHWRVQLNIRNLLDRDNLLVQKTLSTGEGAIFTPQEPRSLILTNTFSF